MCCFWNANGYGLNIITHTLIHYHIEFYTQETVDENVKMFFYLFWLLELYMDNVGLFDIPSFHSDQRNFHKFFREFKK